MARLETEFKKWFRKNWHGWMETYEPRRGGGVGVPDIQIAVNGRIVPIELKVGEIDLDGTLWIDEVRPDQIGWHKRARKDHIITLFSVGIYEKKELVKIAFIWGDNVSGWYEGLKNYFSCSPSEFDKILRGVLKGN